MGQAAGAARDFKINRREKVMALLVFLIILGVLIVVHEWGHFISARMLGIRVETFSIGFGKKIFSKRSKGTEFMISAIPLGGYVKLAGDERSACKGDPDEFFSHSVWHRAIVIAMGPIVNIFFAYLCFVFLFAVTGYPILGNRIGEVMPDYPAYQAGFQAGDAVVQINDEPVKRWVDLQQAVLLSKGKALDFVVERNGKELAINEVIPVNEDFQEQGIDKSYPVVGLKPELKKYGIFRSLREAGRELWDIIKLTAVTLYKVITGQESAKDKLAGPIRIFDVIKDATTMGLAYLIFILAVISANLAFFNLLPIPILDGGHLLFLMIEGIRQKPLSEKVEEGFLKVGASLLICLAVFVFYNDFVQVGWAEKVMEFFQGMF